MKSRPEQKRDRLARLLEAKAAGQLDYPLSWAQERMWFLTQLEPDGAYNLVSSTRLGTALDPGVLAASFTAIVKRHEALRGIRDAHDEHIAERLSRDQVLHVSQVERLEPPRG